MKRQIATLSALAFAAMASSANATEGGGSTYPAAENYMMGAAPPPGFHMLGYATSYASTTLKDGSGNTVAVPGFKVNVNVAVARFVWSTDTQILGGNLLAHVIAPVVDLDVMGTHKSGLGDITTGPAIAFHHSPSLHSVVGLDFSLPTGSYDKSSPSIGRNYVSVQPTYVVSYIDPNGMNADVKLTYVINQKNGATNYKSGDEFFADYSVGYGLGNGWTVGAGGYITQQVTDDETTGVNNGKKSGYAIGPSIRYMSPNNWFITAKFQQEQDMKNTTQGSAFWVKAVIPF